MLTAVAWAQREVDRGQSLLGESDEAGRPLCAAVSIQRTVQLLQRLAELSSQPHLVIVDPPAVLPGPEQGVDLHWEQPTYELLINVPADPAAGVTYYGDDRHGSEVRGELTIQSEREIIAWLAARKQAIG